MALLTFVYLTPQVLCSWGRHIASEVARKHRLLPRIIAFVSLDPAEISLPQSEVLKLIVEAYSLWSVLMGYGLQDAQQSLKDFLPMLIRQLHFYRDKVDINENIVSNELNYNVGSNIIRMLGCALSVAATQRILDTQMKQNKEIQVGLGDRPDDVLQPPILTWLELQLVVQLLTTCTTKWLTQLQRGPTTYAGLCMLGTSCQFVENYFFKWKDQRDCADAVFLSDIEAFYNNSLAPLLQSESLAKLLSKIQTHSALCSRLESSSSEDAKNLGSLNTIALCGSPTPVLTPGSPLPLLAPLVSLLDTLHQLHTSLPSAPSVSLTDHPHMIQYLRYLTAHPLALRTQWFTRIEAKFLANLISIACRKCSCYSLLYHQASLVTLTCLQKGQEHLIRSLLTSTVCNETSVKDLTELTTQVGNIAMDDYIPLKSPALFQPILAPKQLTEKLVSDIEAIGTQLSSSLIDTKTLKQSAVWMREIPFLTSKMTIERSESFAVLDEYWTLLPLKRIMLERIIKMTIANEANKNGKKTETTDDTSDQSKPELIVEVARCLQMTYLCLRYRKKTFMQSSSVTGWIRHLSLTFLVANDLFLDHSVSSYLQGCVRELLSNEGYKLFDNKLEFSGLGNTFDWYKKLIEQYVAVSYSDSTFALLLLLPLQQRCPIAFRSLLWGDLADVLPLIRLKRDEVETFIPVSQFLEPAETDEEMVYKYQSSIATRMVSETRTPFMWQLALHHVSAFQQRQQQ